MDNEIKTRLIEVTKDICYIRKRLDEYIAYQEEICRLRHNSIDEHLKAGPVFRDKVVKALLWVSLNWAITIILLIGFLSIAWRLFTK